MDSRIMDPHPAVRSAPLSRITRPLIRIARARSLEEVVETIRATARASLGCDGIAVILKDGALCHYVEEDAIGPLWKGQKFPAVACISGWSMINRQTAVIPDISKDGRIPQELYVGTFVRALVMVPVGREPVGSIGAYWSRSYEPSEDEIEILEALAEAAAAAIENLEQGPAAPTPAETAPGTPAPFAEDIDAVMNIAAVPVILDIVCRMTGMGFAAVARVTQDSWITCSSLDHLAFGLKPGDELRIESTICNEIRDHREPVVFDDADADPRYAHHHTPKIYGLKSYISVPIILRDGTFFGTLCAIDPKPHKVNTPEIVGAFKLFAELIAAHLDADARVKKVGADLVAARQHGLLREQFIAVLGHDLRNPLAALDAGTTKLMRDGAWTEKTPLVLRHMRASIRRSQELVENVMDLASAKLGAGISLHLDSEGNIASTLSHIIDEVRSIHPERVIETTFSPIGVISVDHSRLAQMLGNLLGNALTHGSKALPVRVALRDTGRELELSVANGGVPISPDLIGKLFEPFFRGDPQNREGLGLGLYIASNIAKAHGGAIEVSSDHTETVFTFRMPLGTQTATRQTG